MTDRSRDHELEAEGQTREGEDKGREVDRDCEVGRAIAELTPEQVEHFERLLARAAKRRWILLAGYLLSLLALVGGFLWALYSYGTADPDSFRAWVFFVPLAAMGIIFTAAGHLARRYEI